MTGEAYAVVLVYSTSYALKAEKHLAKAGITCKLIPVPRQLGSDCGVCVRIARRDRETAEEVLMGAAMQVAGIRDI